MKIEIEISDLELFVKALNNSLAVYGCAVRSRQLGCELGYSSNVREAFDKIPEEELVKRWQELKQMYKQIETLEKEIIKC